MLELYIYLRLDEFSFVFPTFGIMTPLVPIVVVEDLTGLEN